MKKIVICLLFLSAVAHAQEPLQTKVLFANSLMDGNYYYSAAKYSAPSWLNNIEGKLPVSALHFTPGNSLAIEYVSAAQGNWQATLTYHPLRGIDFYKPATHLVFRLYVASETAPSDLPVIAIGERKKETVSQVVTLQPYVTGFGVNRWLTVAIPLKDFNSSLDITSIDMVVLRQPAGTGTGAKTHRLCVDQVELATPGTPSPVKAKPVLLSAEGYEKHVDITWEPVTDPAVRYIKVYRAADNKSFEPVGMQQPQTSRYADFTGVTGKPFYYKIALVDDAYNETPLSDVVSASTRTLTDEEWLDMVQRAQFRYYWEGAEPVSGLSLENIPGRRNMIASGAAGFGVMALIVGAERNFITRQQAVERFDKITQFLLKAEKFHGAFSHFIDGPTASVEPFFGQNDNGGDLVETSFLVQGLLAAQQYFNGATAQEKAIRDRIQKIWEGVDWRWYRRTPDAKYLTWHWSPDKQWVIDHQLIGWNETMITYLLAMASPTHGVPVSMYYTGWASQEEKAQQYRTNWGQTTDGSKYANGNTYYGVTLPVGVSTGGPLFFVHYSYLGPDPRRIKDVYTDYFTNNQRIAQINYRYCVENPEKHRGYGPACWGLTASDGPWHYAANEPTPHGDEGKITPTGALASFPYMPEEAMAALKHYYNAFGPYLWGEYGFRDAISLDDNWCSPIYMGLNQAPVVVMIENHRTGLLWKLFMKNKDVQKALEKLAAARP